MPPGKGTLFSADEEATVSITLAVLSLLGAAVGLGCLVAAVRLWRALKWEVVDDDQLHDRIAAGRSPGGNRLKAWLKPRTRLLTYRRDRRGRFRRYRH